MEQLHFTPELISLPEKLNANIWQRHRMENAFLAGLEGNSLGFITSWFASAQERKLIEQNNVPATTAAIVTAVTLAAAVNAIVPIPSGWVSSVTMGLAAGCGAVTTSILVERWAKDFATKAQGDFEGDLKTPRDAFRLGASLFKALRQSETAADLEFYYANYIKNVSQNESTPGEKEIKITTLEEERKGRIVFYREAHLAQAQLWLTQIEQLGFVKEPRLRPLREKMLAIGQDIKAKGEDFSLF